LPKLLTCSAIFVPPTTIAVLIDSRDLLKALTCKELEISKDAQLDGSDKQGKQFKVYKIRNVKSSTHDV
jgi:hypothetical protein